MDSVSCTDCEEVAAVGTNFRRLANLEANLVVPLVTVVVVGVVVVMDIDIGVDLGVVDKDYSAVVAVAVADCSGSRLRLPSIPRRTEVLVHSLFCVALPPIFETVVSILQRKVFLDSLCHCRWIFAMIINQCKDAK